MSEYLKSLLPWQRVLTWRFHLTRLILSRGETSIAVDVLTVPESDLKMRALTIRSLLAFDGGCSSDAILSPYKLVTVNSCLRVVKWISLQPLPDNI